MMPDYVRAMGADNWVPNKGTVRSFRNQAMRLCKVLRVGDLNIKIRYSTPDRGRRLGSTWEPTANPHQVQLSPVDLDSLVAYRTAFRNFQELVDAAGGYRPTICPKDAWDYVLIAAYNDYQRKRNDHRRTYSPGMAKSFRLAEEAADQWAARKRNG